MARARNIKPGFCKNEDLAECSFEARLCFALLPMLADREGRMEDRPKRIKGELFPFDSIEVEPLLATLESRGFIARYAVNGLGLIQILGFRKHQNPHHREPESELPPHPSLRLEADGKYAKPEAKPTLHDAKAPGKAEASLGLDPPKSDLPRGSNPADSGFSDSGYLIPDTRPPGGKASGTLGVADLVAEGVNAQHAADWLKARKTKSLPLTPTAWGKFKDDVSKAGMTAAEGVAHCAGKGWAGFYTERQQQGSTATADKFAGAR